MKYNTAMVLVAVLVLSASTAYGFHADSSVRSRFLHSTQTEGRTADLDQDGMASGFWNTGASLATSLETFGAVGVMHLRDSWMALVPGNLEKPKHKQEKEPAAKKNTSHNANRPAAPAGKGQMYFRPVSTTLKCVMLLTIVSLLVYTALSISRNADELGGAFHPSAITEMLGHASRVGNLAPMMCMLFVGCRMYVLATTEGLGEPPNWVKACMWVSVSGMLLQLAIAFALPRFTKKAAHKDAEYDMTIGEKAKKEEAKSEALREDDMVEANQEFTTNNERGFVIRKGTAGKITGIDSEGDVEIDFEGYPDIAWLFQDRLHLLSKAKAAEPQRVIDDSEHNDAHPSIARTEFSEEMSAMKIPFHIMQTLAVLLVYCGVAGVITGIVTFPAQSTKISPAVMCTLCLTLLYFVSTLWLWAARAVDTDEEPPGLTKAALAVSSVVRKAPMFAVLFLASRMRALQLDPPLGMPPFWMQCCFKAITVIMYAEAIVAAIIGWRCRMKKGYYGVYLFSATRDKEVGAEKGSLPPYHPLAPLHVVQHILAFITYGALVAIIIGAANMTWADGSPAPLSTTLKCVISFEFAYFGVMLWQGLVMLREVVTRQERPVERDASIGAGVSLSLAPLLCILFVATRMRALQITQQQGAPPGWAQDCMNIAVFATCVQALCCLLMPIFVAKGCNVDEDGNPDYDLEPMVGAYAISVLKYLMLMALHMSVITICVAVFVMTPETAHSGARFINSTKSLFEGLAITMVLFFLSLLFSSAKVVGLAVKFAIEAADQELLGVDITVKKVALNAFKGYVHIQQLRIHNPMKELVYTRGEDGKLKTGEPTGRDFYTEEEDGTITPVKDESGKTFWDHNYVAEVGLLLVKVNLWRILTTLGKEFELENLSITGIHFYIEKPGTDMKKHDSNVEYLINFLDAKGLIPPPEKKDSSSSSSSNEPKKDPKTEAKPQEDPAKKAEKKKEEKKPDIPKIILHKIEFGDIGVSVTIHNAFRGHSIAFSPSIGKITFDDIQRDVFGNREDLTPGETVAAVVSATAQKIFTVVVKDIPKQIACASGQAIKNVGKGAAALVGKVKDKACVCS